MRPQGRVYSTNVAPAARGGAPGPAEGKEAIAMDPMLGVIVEGAASGRTELARRAQHAKVRLPGY